MHTKRDEAMKTKVEEEKGGSNGEWEGVEGWFVKCIAILGLEVKAAKEAKFLERVGNNNNNSRKTNK